MNFDLAIIGGGPGGYTAAEAAARQGLSVVLFEARDLGGTCLNRGCIPTKALLHAAETYRAIRESESLGVKAQGASYDFAAIHARREQVVLTLRQGVEKLLKSAKVTVVRAFAQVSDCGEQGVTIQADGETYEAKSLIVAAGSKPAIPPIPGADRVGVFTSDDLLEGAGKELASLVIIGGGVIGCECASIYADLEAQVTILEAMDHILPPMDRELAQRLTMFLKKRGVTISTSASVTGIEGEPGAMIVRYQDKSGKELSVTAEGVLMATGRRAALEGVFAKAPELQRGALPGNEAGRTALANVFVIGDAKAGNIQLAHVAEAQGKNAVAAILGKPLPVDMNVVPSCIYTSPEIASVGLTEEAAKAAGIAVKTKKALTGANGKCLIEGAESGFVKVVCEAETGRLLGAQLICPRATDLVSEFSVAIAAGLTAEQVAGVIHPHPTFSELISEACQF